MRFSLLLLFVLFAGCGSDPSTPAMDGGAPAPGFIGPDGTPFMCVPDVAPTPRSLHTLDMPNAAPACPPGTHPVPKNVPKDAGQGPLPPMPALCTAGTINNEPKILVGYAPATGQSVDATGQIKVWVNDEGAPIIAPNEQIDPATGVITTPGDRTAKAPDNYLWEPALYIAPQTAENGGTPHFPTMIKGSYNNKPGTKGAGTLVAGMDPPPGGSGSLAATYTSEDIWDVSSLGLSAGTYIAEFVIHDGDRDRGVGCVTIVIKPGIQ